MDAFIRGEDSVAQVVATVRNMTDAPIDKLRVELWSGGKLATVVERTALPAKQSTAVPLSADKPEEFYLIVTAHSGQTLDQVAVTPRSAPNAADSDSTPLFVAWVTSFLSLLGVGLGSILTHQTSYRREKHRMHFEALKFDTERYSPAYREFLSYWKGSASSSQLKNGFEQLRDKAFIPSGIYTLYDEIIATLSDASATVDAKKAAARRLYAAVDELTVTRANVG
ncbi:MAG: hypothetical protein ACRDTC_08825 [Pseudonocardiaceae bacterium]